MVDMATEVVNWKATEVKGELVSSAIVHVSFLLSAYTAEVEGGKRKVGGKLRHQLKSRYGYANMPICDATASFQLELGS